MESICRDVSTMVRHFITFLDLNKRSNEVLSGIFLESYWTLMKGCFLVLTFISSSSIVLFVIYYKQIYCVIYYQDLL